MQQFQIQGRGLLRAAVCLLIGTCCWPGLPFLHPLDLLRRGLIRHVVCCGSSRPLACRQCKPVDASRPSGMDNWGWLALTGLVHVRGPMLADFSHGMCSRLWSCVGRTAASENCTVGVRPPYLGVRGGGARDE